jgi:iron complex outermembrane receptor protein
MRIVVVVALLVLAGSVFAQPSAKPDSVKHISSGEIIVTGFPAEAGKSPVPVTTIPRAEIQAASAFKELPSLLKQLPSVVSYSQNGLDAGYVNVNIRGFDQRRESILVNGVPQNDPEDHSVYWVDMPDLSGFASNIEVQRGAGSSFYGSPAIGGSINVETFPSPERSFTLSAMGGAYNTSKYAVSASSGLIGGKYILSTRLSQYHTNGYRDNDYTNMKSYYFSAARMDSIVTLQFNFYGGTLNDALDYYGLYPKDNNDRSAFTDPVLRRLNSSENYYYERRPQEQEQFVQPHYELLSSIKLDKNLSLYNTFFYVQGDGYFDYDGTWPNLYNPAISHSVLYRLTPDYGLRFNFHGIVDTLLGNELTRGYVGNKQGGWLPRLEYDHQDGMFTIGGEVRIHRSLHWGQLLSAEKMPVGLPGDYHYYEYNGGKDIFSGYISELYSINENINLSASVQLLNQTYHFSNEKPQFFDSASAATQGLKTGFHSYAFDVPLFFVNPRAGLNINFSETVSGILSASYTSREPRLKDYYNAEFISLPNFAKKSDSTYDFSSPLVKPEHLVDIEVGFRGKNLQLDDDLKALASVTGYYLPFTDELLKTGKKDQWGSDILSNAEKVLHYGVELELGIEYSDALAITGNLTISHNEIQQYSQYVDPLSIVGKSPIGFPSMIAGVSIIIKPFSTLDITASMRSIGSTYGDLENSQDYRNDPYTVLDIGASYQWKNVIGLEHIGIRAQINNVTNLFYTTYADAGSGFFVAPPRNGYLSLEIGL